MPAISVCLWLSPFMPPQAQADIPEHSFSASVDALNTGTSLISSLLRIMHMLFLINLRNLASVLLSWTATQ